jgi:isoquinoline 1-oxidoreductase beta subunit
MKTIDKNLSRRNFIRFSSMTGAALTIGYAIPSWAKGTEEIFTAQKADELSIEMTAWISIDKSGKVTILNHRSEMGQGSFQAVPQMIAEELEVNLDQVNILFAPGSQTKYGSQITGGSSTVRGAYKKFTSYRSNCTRNAD